MAVSPSLLDRLVDNDPGTRKESVAASQLGLRDMRRIIRRDLIWLLTTIRLEEVTPLDDWKRVQASVLNYGVRDLSGVPEKNIDALRIERTLRDALIRYEPRLDPRSVDIGLEPFDEGGTRGQARLNISALWANDLYNEAIVIEATIDFETGSIEADGG